MPLLSRCIDEGGNGDVKTDLDDDEGDEQTFASPQIGTNGTDADGDEDLLA